MIPTRSRLEWATVPRPRRRGARATPESFPPCDERSATTGLLPAVPNRRRTAGGGTAPAARPALATLPAAVHPFVFSVQRQSEFPRLISGCSHARAVLQSRAPVTADTLSTSAVSSKF